MKENIRKNSILILYATVIGAFIATLIETPIIYYYCFTKYDWLKIGIIFFVTNLIAMYPVMWSIIMRKPMMNILLDKKMLAIAFGGFFGTVGGVIISFLVFPKSNWLVYGIIIFACQLICVLVFSRPWKKNAAK